MVRLMNRLHRWYLPLRDEEEEGKTAKSIRCFSHLVSHPKDVLEWVPVTLKHLDGTVAFDRRTCECMHEHKIEVLLTHQNMIKAIELL